jgi:parallel beta-helix repeat protein
LRKLAWTSLALLFLIITYCTIVGLSTEKPSANASLSKPTGSKAFETSYTNRGPIIIHKNSDFSSYGFPGTGDEKSPYRIEGYSITDSNSELIMIEDTDVYFIIQNNYLDCITSSLDAIYIKNAKNGHVYNNLILQNRHGIFIDTGCQSMNITNNRIWDSSQSGIRVNSSFDIRIYHNEAYDNTYNGIWTNSSTYLDIRNNTVYNDELGIWLRNSNSSQVVANTLYGNDNALWLSNNSNSNNIQYNRIFDPATVNPNSCGIHLSHNAYGNSFLNNTVTNSTEHAFYVEVTSGNNTIKWNTFIDNNIGGTSQAFDAVSINVLYNYWSDWTAPDDDLDQIVDIPYLLEGPVMNDDPFPLTLPANPPEFHYLTPVAVVYPNGGESITDLATIQWTICYDSEGHAVNYSIYFSYNLGADWTKLAENLTDNHYEWNTTSLLKTTHYLIRVIARCSEGFTVSDESDGEFSLIPHTLSVPTITSPTSTGPFDVTLLITWNHAVDTWGYSVSYSIQYSLNAGFSWTGLAVGLTSNSYEWDLSSLQSDENCVLKVVASVKGGFTSEAVSVTFSIHHDLTPPPPTTTGVVGDIIRVIIGEGVGVAAIVLVLLVLLRKRSSGET